MADGMKRGRGLLALLLACAPLAHGAELADPTRPPSGFAERTQDAPKEAPLRVGSVFLMGAKPYAILDGQVVRVGDKLEAGRVSRIDETGVWLKTPAGSRQLKLLPDVEKTPVGQSTKKVEKR